MTVLRTLALNLRGRKQAFEDACEAGDVQAAIAACDWLLLMIPVVAVAWAFGVALLLAADCFTR